MIGTHCMTITYQNSIANSPLGWLSLSLCILAVFVCLLLCMPSAGQPCIIIIIICVPLSSMPFSLNVPLNVIHVVFGENCMT